MPGKTTRKRVARVLLSQTVLKMYFKLSSKYLVAEDVAESFGAKSFSGTGLGIKDFFYSYISLSTREKVLEVSLTSVVRAKEAQSLHR